MTTRSTPPSEPDRTREALLHRLRELGIRDRRVLAALQHVPRDRFVPLSLLPHAYDDRPLPIGHDQTISQPYIVALSTQALALAPTDRVLEVGTGSGYQTAVLAELAGAVHTVERLPELSSSAQKRLRALGYSNIQFRVGDGTLGWPEESPFDGILITAGAPRVPERLLTQLAPRGRLVIPVGGRLNQVLFLVHRDGEHLVHEHLCPCTFVPLIGEEGWT